MELRDRLFLMFIRGSIFSTSTLHAPFGHTYHVLDRKPNKEKELPKDHGNTNKIKLPPGTSATFTVSGSEDKFEAREYREQAFPYHDPGLVVIGGGKKVALGPNSGEVDDPTLGRLRFIDPGKNSKV